MITNEELAAKVTNHPDVREARGAVHRCNQQLDAAQVRYRDAKRRPYGDPMIATIRDEVAVAETHRDKAVEALNVVVERATRELK